MKTGLFLAAAALAQLAAAQPHRHHHARLHAHHKVHKAEAEMPHNNMAPSSGGVVPAFGISYSPYNADGSCKTQDEVNSDFDKMTGYSVARIYGVDCNQVATVSNAAIARGMKVFLGVFDLSDVSGDLQTLIHGVNGNFDHVDTISIGNELVNDELNSVQEVVSALETARGTLKAAGYTGNLVTVDTFNAVIDNPELCKASDYAAVNAHAFFDPDVSAPGAGKWLKNTVNQVQNACGGMLTVVTESGWPHQGSANGQAVPGVEQQNQAISSIKNEFSNNVILYSAFDELWKANTEGTFDAENYYGILSGQ